MINDKTLLEKKGGISQTLFMAIGGLVALLIGFIDGLVRPLKCNN